MVRRKPAGHPFGPGKQFWGGTTGALSKVIGGWQINGILKYFSGNNVGVSCANTLPLFNARNNCDIVPGVPQQLFSGGDFDPARDVYLNVGAFAEPEAFTVGDAPNFLPGIHNFAKLNEDFGLLKRTNITERVALVFRFEMFNAFNRVRLGGPNGGITNSAFGTISGQANTPRRTQFGLKIEF